MTQLESEIEKSKTLTAGGDHYRAFVGPPNQYGFMGATQFCLLHLLGLREEHRLLDVGCGSLRAGRYLIQFLLPGRYHGIEPNSWLWQDAVEREIGADLISLKEPKFDAGADFDFEKFETQFDFVVAQSIFSHTAKDLFERAIGQVSQTLSPNGQFLFTVLDESAAGFGVIEDGRSAKGWIYPRCVTFPEADIRELCSNFGLFVQPMNWFHPRQRWYRAVLKEKLLLSPEMGTSIGSGHPQFDARFPTPAPRTN